MTQNDKHNYSHQKFVYQFYYDFLINIFQNWKLSQCKSLQLFYIISVLFISKCYKDCNYITLNSPKYYGIQVNACILKKL